ncbi:MAG: adenylate/guanylate cyclase domain-containing protein [Planctomycetes bacterium]|nr:adenylate/guanylate cyclase domain-containing protein [Planctomycetota bacterium]MCG2682983.1 adenylate/guanylate cyclase domain-containing protein [Planctomycetales bacterium]
MPDLIAQGTEAQQRWRRPLPEGQEIVLGRFGGVWAVPWDHQVSRRHVGLSWNGRRLEVQRLPEAKNPVFLHGKEAERFELSPGEHFVVGQTTFTLADQQVDVTVDQPAPVQQQSFSSQYLKGVQFRNPDHRIEVLSRLPDVISGAAGDKELFVRLVSMLLAGVPRADAAAVVAVEEGRGAGDEGRGREEGGEESVIRLPPSALRPPPSSPAPRPQSPAPLVMHWDQRLAITGNFRPSQGLILESLRQGQSVLHVWRGAASASPESYTASDSFDWAFCAPVLGKSCRGWGLYVAGRFNVEQSGATPSSDPTDLREDVKFTELVAAMLSSLRQMRLLEHRHATLSQFFSPVVLDSLADEDPEVVLAPRETEVSVIFCDLRGFSRESERQAGDLLGLLQRVSKALGVMTHHIREQGGVVGDFQGDAAMGFWGWPLPQEDAVLRTCRAALAVRAEFEAATGFRTGIGVATGPAVAGKIGTVDQVKVTVFGPVVNLASRLEGMTKIIQAPILLDEATARIVRREVPRDVARVRRLAIVRPYGLDTPLEVSELLPPVAEYPELTDEHLEFYEAALDAFLSGKWPQAFELLHRIPAQDQVKDFLVVHIARHNRRPPPDWDGVVPLASK